MRDNQEQEPSSPKKLLRLDRNKNVQAEPVTFKNLSDILEPLKPDHRRIVLDEFPQGLANGSLRVMLKKEVPPEIEVQAPTGRLHTRAYQNFRIQDTPESQKWLRDRAIQCEDALLLKEGFSQDMEAELDADPERFERLSLAYWQQCQDKARRKKKGKDMEASAPDSPTPVPQQARQYPILDPTSPEYSPPYITPKKPKKSV